MALDGQGLVHLVGSFPVRSASEVFETAGRALGQYASRLPDGEPQGWLNFSNDAFYRATGVELIEGKDPKLTGAWEDPAELKRRLLDPDVVKKARGPSFRIKPSLAPKDVTFAPTGYVELAVSSYKLFVEARKQGKIAQATKFQQSMPTPFIMLREAFLPEEAAALQPSFERHLLAEVAAICDAIPSSDLAFQWDVVEVARIEAGRGGASLEEHAQLISRACNTVPSEVDMGVHLCYGNAGGRHSIEPKDTAVMVEYANAFMPLLHRRLDWLHMPVPIARNDDGYFAPLARLKLPANAAFYLGLVHPVDGVDGAERRVAAAKKVVPRFGVGTECGLRFFPASQLAAILKLHRDVALLAADSAPALAAEPR
jgi:methionine synthase II (cobalamin-independent)